MANEIALDLEAMTLGELETIEEVAGPEAAKAMMTGQMSAKALLAVAYVVRRRDDPAFTIEDARSLKITALKPADATGKGNGNSA